MRSELQNITKIDINQGVPEFLKPVFNYLYADIGWYGVLNGTVITFLSVYAARIGASAEQIGFINAIPAVIAIIFAIPAGSWLGRGNSLSKVVISSIIHRAFYILLIFLPFISTGTIQIQVILLMILIMSFPGTVLQVGFNDLFAETVPATWRGHVAGVRNALFSIISVIVLLMSGQLLKRILFPINYQIVFGLGFIGAMLSSLYLWLINHNHAKVSLAVVKGKTVLPQETENQPNDNHNSNIKFSLPSYRLNKAFYQAMGLMFLLNLAIYLAAPVFPIFWVNNMHLTDQVISIGNGLFFLTNFLGSTQIARLAGKHGNQRVVGVGAILMAFYPALLSISHEPFMYYITSLGGGIASSLVGGLLINYLLGKTPETKRHQYLAVYNIFLFTAVLMGSLAGPAIGTLIGLPTAMILFAVVRLFAGAAIFWKG